MSENDVRLQLFESICKTPHLGGEKPKKGQKLSKAQRAANLLARRQALLTQHKAALNADPLFYGHMAVWYDENGDVRDHKDAFIATLFGSEFPEHREAAFMLMQSLPPVQVARVMEYCALSWKKRPRQLRTAIAYFLRKLEKSDRAFDDAVMYHRRWLHQLYAMCHIAPSERAQAILFDDAPPPNSLPAQLKQIAKMTDPAAQAQALVKYDRIPFTTGVGLVGKRTPAVMVALVNAMTPQQVINNLDSINRSGVMENAEVKQLVHSKLDAAKTKKTVAAFKTKVAKAATKNLDAETAKKLDAVTDAQVQRKGSIKRPTLLVVDKSGSLAQAIDIGKQLAALISAIAKDELYVYAIDGAAIAIKADGKELSDWERAFKMIRAGGQTSLGAALKAARINKQRVEQIVMVTDQGENQRPLFVDEYKLYCEAMCVKPSIVIVSVGTDTGYIERQMATSGAELEKVRIDTTDYYALPNVITLLSKPSKVELVMEIMELPLPRRNAAAEQAVMQSARAS